jgi:hypothetical protein
MSTHPQFLPLPTEHALWPAGQTGILRRLLICRVDIGVQVARVASGTVPMLHGRHSVEPEEEIDPSGHVAQVFVPPGEYVPAGQALHDEDPGTEVEPLGQAVHRPPL